MKSHESKMEWRKFLISQRLKLCQGDYPVWLDGFFAVLIHNHTSHPDDNPYDQEGIESEAWLEWRNGALAAEISRAWS
jgi:hypothetical protein